MKFKPIRLTLEKFFKGAFVALLAMFAVACDDSTTVTSAVVTSDPFDPNKPILITGFTPETGGYQEDIIVKGQNFGNDKSALTLKIGGKTAVVINVMSDKLYAFVPSGAFSGEVEITITDESGNEYKAVADKKFEYVRKTVVGTLCGYQNENDDQGQLFGSFDECCGFNMEGCFTFDPLYPDRLYVVYDGGGGSFIGELDLEKRTYNRLMTSNKFQNERLRNAAFTLDGEYMLVSTDRGGGDNQRHSTSVWIVKRNSDGTFSDSSNSQPLVAYKQCNGVAVHPINGEIYFNSYEGGQLFRMELQDYFDAKSGKPDADGNVPEEWTGYFEDGAFTELFKIKDPGYEFQVTIHPTGKYAYLTVINRHYILRSDYDEEKKEFTTPYVVAGADGQAGWFDAVGTNARLDRPYQGVFVKNPEYEAEGREDVYDYYYCDNHGWCVRYITPDGLVRTYAGRSPSTNGNIWGTEDGGLRDQARFRDVSGIAYDEKREMFYVLDNNNRRVRTIGKEAEEPVVDEPTDEPTEEPSEEPSVE